MTAQAAGTASAPIASLAVFGDSLSDDGLFFAQAQETLTAPLPSAAFGYAGHFSNGPAQAAQLGAALGLEDEALRIFAVGGARAVGETPFAAFVTSDPSRALLAAADPDPAALAFDINLGAQVARYLAELAAGAPPVEAAALFIGSNDYNAAAPRILALPPEQQLAAAQALIAEIAGATVAAAQTLAASGVGTIVFYTLIDGARFPATGVLDPATEALFELIVDAHNAALAQAAAGLAAFGVDAKIVDTNALFDHLAADPSSANFLDVEAGFWLGTGADPYPIPGGPLVGVDGTTLGFAPNPALAGLDADRFAFFDQLHPTTAAHGVIAGFAAASLAGPLLRGGEAGERLSGGAGADLILAFGGDDRAKGYSGDDVLLAGQGDDRLFGGEGDDVLIGGGGADRLFGEGGADVLAGSDGDDRAEGGSGGDLLIGGAGADVLYGQDGDDVFLFAAASLTPGETAARDRVWGGDGRDTLIAAFDAADYAIEAAALADRFVAGEAYRFATVDLVARGVEAILLVEGRDALAEAALASGAEGAAAADLWNLV